MVACLWLLVTAIGVKMALLCVEKVGCALTLTMNQ